MIQLQFPKYDFKIKEENGVRYIFDIIRKRHFVLTPEEWVRQNILHYLIHELQYPKGLCAVEKEITINKLKKRYDIVVYDRNQNPWMLIECKEPNVPITESTLNQLLQYHQKMQCRYWMLTNGKTNFCGRVENGQVTWLESLPGYEAC